MTDFFEEDEPIDEVLWAFESSSKPREETFMTVGWLTALTGHLGDPEHDEHGEMNRWTWHDGDAGVLVDRLTSVWQIVAWTPVRSVTVRSVAPPDDRDCSVAVALAGLDTHRLAAPA